MGYSHKKFAYDLILLSLVLIILSRTQAVFFLKFVCKQKFELLFFPSFSNALWIYIFFYVIYKKTKTLYIKSTYQIPYYKYFPDDVMTM
jgi:hypothetical protein